MTATQKGNYCVIMAGGIGSRFWPLSRSRKPKQFLDILGVGKTLIQQTFHRFRQICPLENIYIVTNANYEKLVLEQLPQLSPEQVLLEPMRRNTAPCIAYANAKIAQRDSNARIVVAPSDHLILDEAAFLEVIKQSFDFVEQQEALLTLGMSPTRPETGYGYIQVANKEVAPDIHKVKTFTEKPDYEMAKLFYESGDFYWNAGIFIWSLKTIDAAFKRYLPGVADLFARGSSYYGTDHEQDFIDEIYPECRNISIDYGIMEKADNVYVLCADFGWSDLGTWGSLYENLEKDDKANAISGAYVLPYDTANCIISSNPDKLVVVQGLDDYIVINTHDALLICKKDEEQRIRQFVNDVKMERGEIFL